MGAGTYGTVDSRVKNSLEKIQSGDGAVSNWTKLRYIWKRLFPDKTFMKQYHPFCRRHEWSIPFFRIYRLVKGTVCRSKEIRKECRAITKVK